MNLHFTDYVIIALTLLYALIGYLMLRGKKRNKAEIILTGLLGGFVLLAGTVKLFDPFSIVLFEQIASSSNPVPDLTRWLVLSGEIGVGYLMLIIAFCHSRLPKNQTHSIFVVANLLIIMIGVVDYTVQYFYDITAIILPIDSKPQFVGILLIAFAFRNLLIHRVNHYKYQRKSGHQRQSGCHSMNFLTFSCHTFFSRKSK